MSLFRWAFFDKPTPNVIEIILVKKKKNVINWPDQPFSAILKQIFNPWKKLLLVCLDETQEAWDSVL